MSKGRKIGLASLVLAGSSLVGFGCGAMQHYAATHGRNVAAGRVVDDVGTYWMTQELKNKRTRMQAQGMRDAAKTLRGGDRNDQTTSNPDRSNNMNNYSGEWVATRINHSEFGRILIASANYVNDFNGDGVIDYPNEFGGLKRVFPVGERISVSLRANQKIPNLSYRLVNGNGEVLENVSFNLSSSIEGIYNLNDTEFRSLFPNGLSEGEINRLGPGNYRTLFYSGSELITFWEFRVVDN